MSIVDARKAVGKEVTPNEGLDVSKVIEDLEALDAEVEARLKKTERQILIGDLISAGMFIGAIVALGLFLTFW